MKLFPIVGLLVATVCLMPARGLDTPTIDCPPQDEFGGNDCQCFKPLRFISCSKVESSFNLKKDYSIAQLTIRNAASLTKINGQQTDPKFKLIVEDLVIIQDNTSPPKVAFMDNLEPLLAVSTKSVKILGDPALTEPLDVADLPYTLGSLIIENIPSLNGFVAANFVNLKQLVLRNLKLAEMTDGLVLLNSQHMTTLEITHVGNLKGAVTFKPKTCPADEKIHIKLSETGLTDIDLSALFVSGQPCKYHIELANNAFPIDYFSKQALALLKFDRKSLYLSLESNQAATCNCDTFNAKEKHLGYIYGIKCDPANLKSGKPGYLENLKKDDFAPPCVPPSGH